MILSLYYISQISNFHTLGRLGIPGATLPKSINFTDRHPSYMGGVLVWHLMKATTPPQALQALQQRHMFFFAENSNKKCWGWEVMIADDSLKKDYIFCPYPMTICFSNTSQWSFGFLQHPGLGRPRALKWPSAGAKGDDLIGNVSKSTGWNWKSLSGCFRKWWVSPPFHTPKLSFLLGKPIVVGETHHFRKPPSINQLGRCENYLIKQDPFRSGNQGVGHKGCMILYDHGGKLTNLWQIMLLELPYSLKRIVSKKNALTSV